MVHTCASIKRLPCGIPGMRDIKQGHYGYAVAGALAVVAYVGKAPIVCPIALACCLLNGNESIKKCGEEAPNSVPPSPEHLIEHQPQLPVVPASPVTEQRTRSHSI